ncbi:Rieske (2Fe-2S) protein [Streptomyces sp. TRM66268-LWL]|uniref:Cytochrome bc1 complex Rieske iron-sulfur subunit n=1 Tax=Streptomyces polyasparticus TaxID=2767826 RepID=A0ABR7SKP8_9ACTN|nr:Rieske (2Fe-2S) protein [Streptomyces polyasparticus]MBC9715285.1 Rieske (2Fe-2S) protein [Streptomyces polyasparticus]
MTTRRRTVLAAGALAIPVVAGCQEYGNEQPEPEPPAGTDDGQPSGQESPGGEEKPGGGAELAKTSEIEVGGGKVFEAEKVVVTQPAAGDFKAFSAVCTHSGCTVANVEDGTINCACHGSKYALDDASVQGGPAPRPLAARKINVEGDSISLA